MEEKSQSFLLPAAESTELFDPRLLLLSNCNRRWREPVKNGCRHTLLGNWKIMEEKLLINACAVCSFLVCCSYAIQQSIYSEHMYTQELIVNLRRCTGCF